MAASAAGGVAGVSLGLASQVIAGALLALPAVVGAGLASGAAIAIWAATYRYYLGQVEEALKQTLELLPGVARAMTQR